MCDRAMKQLQLLLAIIPLLIVASVSNVYASGPRLDYDEGYEDVPGAPECWIDGYDAGFAGKYDQDRANECADIPGDQYNASWGYGCEDSHRTEKECGDLIDNPVEIEDFEALKSENDRVCYDAGREDGEAGRPFNKDRDEGCYEFDDIGGGYEGGYQSGCETHTTEASCKLLYEDKSNYCPNHPDIVGCVDFLHNDANKRTENPMSACAGMGDPRPNIICPQEVNPERYCLEYYNPTFCKTIGDLCDEDGFVKPEYSYCTK